MNRRSRWSLSFAAAAVLFFGTDASGIALAASCSQLEARLASASKASPNRAKAKRYASALKRQRGELARTRSMAKRAGCRVSSRSSSCKTLNGAIRKMEARVAELDATRRKALGGSGSAATRRSIKAQMKRKGCGQKPRAVTVEKRPRKSPSVAAPKTEVRTASATPSVDRPRSAPTSGSYRTMCVRTCDGYYFPISNATGPAAFRHDANRCASMCPASETKLFVHHGSNDVDSMVDRVGRRYTSMPYAFRHQSPDYRPSAGCSCGRPLAPTPAGASLRGSTATLQSVTTAKVASGDAETRRNAAIDFGWSDAEALVAKTGEGETGERPVRVVGPVFLPDR